MGSKHGDYVLLFSEKQQQFHIEPLEVMFGKMRMTFINGSTYDYRPLGAGKTIEELEDLKELLIRERGTFTPANDD